MQIKNIHLVNYRGMEDLTVEFGPGVNLVIGDNGAGKTSLLSGISLMLSRLFGFIGGLHTLTIEKKDVRMTSTSLGEATGNAKYHTPVEIEYDLEAWDEDYHDKCQKNHEDSPVELSASPAAGKMKTLVEDNDSILPLLNYQEDQRNGIRTEAKTTTQFAIEKPERRQGYQDCFSSSHTFEAMEKWSLYMEFYKAQSGREAQEYGIFKGIVSKFIKEIEKEEKDPCVRFSIKQMQLTYSDGDNEQPIRLLSAGYQSILCLIMELAYRTALLNPRLEKLENLEGVVLIDEIDMHLHPKWQWKVLGALQSTFPKVQFIVATHSPIVISSAENAQLLLMRSPNEVEELPDAYGINIDDILELRQGSADMPPELKAWRREIRDALNRNDLPQAQAIIRKAEEARGKGSAPVKSLRNFLDINKWIAGG